ncbi:hypothetical protein Dpoa2040_002645 [Dickeya sp. CFBP 2040]|uniref:hypothetical protein n=1 Tax=Dickeya sp. CFBP 2040 TaxID=2718531 RepID=UPI001444C640|nr:hypothetical protein [Dickeya sp. CFBP 2040]NKI75357.1 hypothetical protein [Dickeya sp. CFBP 2040]
MASEKERSGRGSLNKQRIINPITSTLAADVRSGYHEKPSGKRSNSIGENPTAGLHLSLPDKRCVTGRNHPKNRQQNRPPFIPIHTRKSKMKMVKKATIFIKTADVHLQPTRAV